MIITCEECNSGFVLDGSLLKPGGSKVRCSSCGNIFLAYPSAPADMPEAKAVAAPPTTATKQKPAEIAVPVKIDKQTPAITSDIESITPNEDDPDLTKAVEQIVEEELSFSDEELMVGEIPSIKLEKTKANKTDEIPQIEIDESIDEEDDILDFSDFELDMDESDIPVSSSQDLAIEDDDLDFSDLELELDDDSQENDNDQINAFSGEEDLDFSDLELALDDDSQKNDSDQINAFSGEEDLDFSDLELALDDDSQKNDSDQINAFSDEEDLDFSDLELALDDDSQAGQTTDIDHSIDSLGLEIEDDPNDSATIMTEDEFDFSDLEAELSDDSLGTSGDTSVEIEDLELDLELESDEPETLAIMDDDLDFSDFELEMEEDSVDEDELDFSDLAGMLSKETPENESLIIDEDIELDLELDEDLALELENGKSEEVSADEELDFSDLENILDNVDTTEKPVVESAQEEDIELELDMEEDSDFDIKLSSDSLEDGDESFDFSDVEAMLEADDDSEELELDLDSDFDDLDGIDFATDGDIKLELSLDKSEKDDNIGDILGDDAIESEEDMAYASEKTMRIDNKKIDIKKIKVKPKRKASGKGKLFLKVFFILLFLLFISIGVFLSRGKIENITGFLLPAIPPVEAVREKLIQAALPFVSEWVRIVDKDPKGILGLATSNINGDYITNDISGKMFVIKGKIQNNYPDTRNSISLKCLLINAEGKTVKSATVYAGNFISDERLKTMDIMTVNNILKQRLGENNINAKVRPGQKLPFIVVFSDLTEAFTEFSVAPESSSQGAAIK